MKRVREYFYGSPKLELAPYSTVVYFTDVDIRRVGESMVAPASALPLGSEQQTNADKETKSLTIVKVDPGDILLHSILAISHSSSEGDQSAEGLLIESNCAGFIYVNRVEEKKRRMFVLAPTPGKLPRRNLWLGTLRWAEL